MARRAPFARRPPRLRRVLVIWYLVASIPLIAAVTTFAVIEKEHHFEQAIAEQRTETEALAAAQTRHTERVRQLLEVLALRADDLLASGTCDDQLDRAMAASSGLLNLGLADPDGWVACSAMPHADNVSIADRPYFQRALARQAFASGGFQVGRITDEVSLNFGVPVRTGDAAGSVVYAAVDADWLASQIHLDDFASGSVALIIDAAARIVVHVPPAPDMLGAVVSSRPPRTAEWGDGESIQWTDPSGRGTVWTVVPFGDGQLAVAVGTPQEALATGLATADSIAIAALVLAMLLSALLIAGVAEHYVLGPLDRLRRAIDAPGAGTTTAVEAGPSTPHEIRALAREFDDLTRRLADRAASEHALRELAEENADDLERLLRWRTTFVATIAHDLAGPLVPILMQCDLIANDPQARLSPRDRERIAVIERSAARIEALVRDLVEVSRLHTGQLRIVQRPLDLGDWIGGAVEPFHAQAEKKDIEIEIRAEPHVPAMADPHRLERVLANLLGNALKFTPSGGHIQVDVRAQADHAEVTVKDDGIGLSQEDLRRVFQPFVQVLGSGRTVPQGSGLGLYITKGLVEAHGGHVWAESEGLGRGTCFGFSLPYPGPTDAGYLAPASGQD